MKMQGPVFVLLMVFLALFAGIPQGNAQDPVSLWNKDTDDYDWMGTSTERSIAFHNNKLYVASRGDGNRIRIIDASNGNDIGSLDASSFSGGVFPLNTVAISDDGYIFASNLTVDAENSPFRVYVWENEDADPYLVKERSTNTNLRIGDHLSVVGSVSEGTAVMYAPISFDDGRLLRWAIQLDVNDDIEFVDAGNGNDHMNLPNITAWGSPPFVAPKGPGTGTGFWAGGRSGNFSRSYTTANVPTGYAYIPASGTGEGNTALSYQQYIGNEYLYAYKATARRFYINQIGAADGVWNDRTGSNIYTSPQMGSTTEITYGDMVVVNNGDGSLNIYVLATNNGIWAYHKRYDDNGYATLFELSDMDNNLPYWLTASGSTERSIAAHDGSLFMISRRDGLELLEIDAQTGSLIQTSEIIGAEGGTFLLNSLSITDDGVILAANLADPASDANPFKVYRLSRTGRADPIIEFSTQSLSFDDSRLGDFITVSGNWYDGTATLYAGDARRGANPNFGRVFRWTMTGNGNGPFGEPDLIILDEDQFGVNPSISPLPNGDFYWNAGSGRPARKFESDGSFIGEIPVGVIPIGAAAIRYLGNIEDDEYFITNIWAEDEGNVSLVRVPNGVPADAEEIFRTPPKRNTNPQGLGDVTFQAYEDGRIDMNVLTVNNALAGYRRWLAGLELPDFGDPPEEPVTNITNWYELDKMRFFPDESYTLLNDLDENTPGYSTYNTGDGWLPVGSTSEPFTGSFDGGGFTITGLMIDRTTTNTGLFGYLEDAEIENLGLLEVDITSTNWNTGALAGSILNTIITDCHSSGTITAAGENTPNYGGLVGRAAGNDSEILRSWSSVNLDGDNNTGGLVGYLQNGKIEDCFASGNITSSGVRIGGLVGRSDAEVNRTFSTGNVSTTGSFEGNSFVGGLIGRMKSTASVNESFSSGSVSGSAGSVGGLIGQNFGTGAVTNSFWDTQTSGRESSGGGAGKETVVMKAIRVFIDDGGWDFQTIWSLNGIYNDGYPYLRVLAPDPPFSTWFEEAFAFDNEPGWLGDDRTERGIAAFDDEILVLSRQEGLKLFRLNQKTGAPIGEPLTLTGASGGRYALNDIAASGDGVLYAANLTENAENTAFRVYQINDSGKAQGVIEFYTEQKARIGDRISVVGNWDDGGVIIYATDAEEPIVYRWTMQAGGQFGEPDIIDLDLDDGGTPYIDTGSPAVSPFPDGSFYWNAGGIQARKFNQNGNSLGPVPEAILPLGSNSIRYLGSVGDDEYIASYLFGNGMGNFALIKLPDGDPEEAELIFRTPSLRYNDPAGLGDLSFLVDDDILDLYVLTTNNAIAGYRYEISGLVQPDFSTGNIHIAIEIEENAGWRMLSPPLVAKYEDLFANLVTQGFDGADFEDDPANPATFTPNLMWWDETEAGTTLQGWRTPDSITDPIPGGRGLFHFTFDGAQRPDEATDYPDELPITITLFGEEYPFENDHFDFDITYTERDTTDQEEEDYIDRVTADAGWNLIGNPTASTLNWDHGEWTKTDVDNSIYVWDPSENKYLVWNGINGDFNGLIAPFQAFWVKASDDGPVLRFTEDVKTIGGSFVGGIRYDPSWIGSNAHPNRYRPDNTSDKKKPQKTDEGAQNNRLQAQVLSMELEAGGMQARTWVMLSDKGRLGPDRYDAYRLEPLSNSWASAATAMEPGAPSLAINSLPAEIESLLHLPLYVGAAQNGVATEGEFELHWTLSDTWEDHLSVTLMDHQEKFALNMREKSNYRFAHATEAPLLSRHMREQSGFLSAEGKDAGNGVASASRPGIVYGLPGRIPFTFSAPASDSKVAATEEWQKEKNAYEADNYRSGRSFRMDPEAEGFDEQRLRNPGAPPSGFSPEASGEGGAGGLYQEMSSRGVCLNVWGLQGGGAKTGGTDATDVASFPLSVSDEEADGPAATGPLFAVSGPIALPRFSLVISAEGEPGYLPLEPVLSQNYPNPFNSATAIPFTLPSEQRVRLEVFDILGRRVAVLADGELPAGTHTIRWDASGVASGVYLYRMVTNEKAFTRKMTLVR